MHVEYQFFNANDLEAGLRKVIISPDDANQNILNAIVRQPEMQIINPARIFAKKIKSGEFEGWTTERINEEAEVCNIISDSFRKKPQDNIFSVMSELMLLYVRQKKLTEAIERMNDE